MRPSSTTCRGNVAFGPGASLQENTPSGCLSPARSSPCSPTTFHPVIGLTPRTSDETMSAFVDCEKDMCAHFSRTVVRRLSYLDGARVSADSPAAEPPWRPGTTREEEGGCGWEEETEESYTATDAPSLDAAAYADPNNNKHPKQNTRMAASLPPRNHGMWCSLRRGRRAVSALPNYNPQTRG